MSVVLSVCHFVSFPPTTLFLSHTCANWMIAGASCLSPPTLLLNTCSESSALSCSLSPLQGAVVLFSGSGVGTEAWPLIWTSWLGLVGVTAGVELDWFVCLDGWFVLQFLFFTLSLMDWLTVCLFFACYPSLELFVPGTLWFTMVTASHPQDIGSCLGSCISMVISFFLDSKLSMWLNLTLNLTLP